jgi:hypothetical protein
MTKAGARSAGDIRFEGARRLSHATLQRRRLDFKSWPEALADIEHLQHAGYDRAGNWDLSQVLDHVGEGLRTALRGNEHRANWIIRKFLGPMILPRILRDRRMKAGIKVPQWWLPGPTHDESAAVDRFRADLTTFQAMTTTPFPHPFFGAMTKQQWNDLALIHAAHHLGFLIPRA